MEEMIIDTQEIVEETPISTEAIQPAKTSTRSRRIRKEENPEEELVSCLRKEKVTVRFLAREKTGLAVGHPFYGGLADNAFIDYTVPLLKNGTYKDPLTKKEKDFLEDYLGLEVGSLSVYNKVNNFWDNFRVRLTKIDTILDLSDANDYIKYKVLLVNKDFIADSLETLRNTPLETYRFVIISDSEAFSSTANKVETKSQCWKEFGKVEDNEDILRCIIHTIDGRYPSENTKIEFLKSRIDKLIESDSRRFLSVIKDPLLPTKVIIQKAWERGVVEKKGDYYYFNNTPMCEKNENPTFTIAAKYLSLAKNQEIKFAIEAKIK